MIEFKDIVDRELRLVALGFPYQYLPYYNTSKESVHLLFRDSDGVLKTFYLYYSDPIEKMKRHGTPHAYQGTLIQLGRRVILSPCRECTKYQIQEAAQRFGL